MLRFVLKIYQKYVIFKNFKKSKYCVFLFNSTSYNCFKVFLGNFIHYIELKISKYVYQYILNKIHEKLRF